MQACIAKPGCTFHAGELLGEDPLRSFWPLALQKCVGLCAGGSEVQVGVVHNVFWTEPKSKGPLYTHVKYITPTLPTIVC